MISNILIFICCVLSEPRNLGNNVKCYLERTSSDPDRNLQVWTRPFPMFIVSRGFGKSFFTSLYCILKCTLYREQDQVVGAGFRR